MPEKTATPAAKKPAAKKSDAAPAVVFAKVKNDADAKAIENTTAALRQLRLGEMVTGKIVSNSGRKMIVDVDGFATGVISGREMRDSWGSADELKAGDEVTAVVIEPENRDGNYRFSIRRAAQDKSWKKFEELFAEEKIFPVRAKSANRGGLLYDIDGIKAFLPVSQLAPEHYPRVPGGDAGAIEEKLNELVGKELSVRVDSLSREEGKLIFSERKAFSAEREKVLENISAGDVVSGKVSGLATFGAFVQIDGGLEGLVHISELDWNKVHDPRDFVREGQEVEVMVLGVDEDRLSFSMKRTKSDPWLSAAEKFPVGTAVEAEVSQVADYGIFLRLGENVAGLAHISEIPELEAADLEKSFKVGSKVKAVVVACDPEEHRLGLSLVKSAAEAKKAASGEKVEKEEVKKAAKKSDDLLAEIEEEAGA